MSYLELSRDEAVKAMVRRFAEVADDEVGIHGDDPEIGVIFTQAIVEFITGCDKAGFAGLVKTVSQVLAELE